MKAATGLNTLEALRRASLEDRPKAAATETLAHPRDIFRSAIQAGATRLMVAHNHPSASVDPSPEDIASEDASRASSMGGTSAFWVFAMVMLFRKLI